MSKPVSPLNLKPAVVSITIDRLRIVIPAAVVIAVLLAFVPGIGAFLTSPRPRLTPVPTLTSTPDTPLAQTLFGVLPAPGPNQKRAGSCDPEKTQVEINGGCWMETKKPPPCPQGKLWEHEGKCWIPVGEAKPVPTSGDVQRASVAGP